MDLFNGDSHKNLLPFDGEVVDCGIVLNFEKSSEYFNQFITANFWEHDELIIFGKRIVTARKVAWFGDANYQ